MAEPGSSAGEIASTAAEATANLAGVGLGALFAGAEGAVAGAVVGPSLALALKHAAAQVGVWITGRQEDRVSEAIRVAASDLAQYLSQGQKLHEAFVNGDDSEPSGAEAIAEGVLQTVAFSYEQKKAVYLGHLLASVAVSDSLSVADAHQLTRLVGQLSYRQLVWLSEIGGQPTKTSIELLSVLADKVMRNNHDGAVGSFADELLELRDFYGLIATGEDEDDSITQLKIIAPNGPEFSLILTARGRNLFTLLRLESLPDTDRREVVEELHRARDASMGVEFTERLLATLDKDAMTRAGIPPEEWRVTVRTGLKNT
jgi:hypothetical protein